MIARWWTAWRARRLKREVAAELAARLRAEPFPPPPPVPPVGTLLPPPGRTEHGPAPAAARDQPEPTLTTAQRVAAGLPPRPPSAYVGHVWPPIPPPLPPGPLQLRPAAVQPPPCDPAWRAETDRRPGQAVYPPPRRQPGWLDSRPGDVT